MDSDEGEVFLSKTAQEDNSMLVKSQSSNVYFYYFVFGVSLEKDQTLFSLNKVKLFETKINFFRISS